MRIAVLDFGGYCQYLPGCPETLHLALNVSEDII